MASFFTSDPFIGLPEGQAIHFADFVDQSTEHTAEFRRAYLDAAGGVQILGVDLRAASGFEPHTVGPMAGTSDGPTTTAPAPSETRNAVERS